MANFNNLKFFDKKGRRHNFEFNGEYFEGSIYLPAVSAELIENDHMFIVEEFEDGSGDTKFGFPLADTYTSPSDPNWRVRWEDEMDIEKIFLYQIQDEWVEEEQKSYPFIQKYSSLEIEVDQIAYTVDETTERKVVADLEDITSGSLSINIGASSELEEILDRVLIIEDISGSEPIMIARVALHAETIEEDHRFKLLLENFGRVFNEQDAFILRDYDIKEEKPDWKDINRKRKELLLTGEEIFPFMGSYKGLVNAIKFFEYQDLRVKEYWLNINPDSENYEKYQLTELTGLIDTGCREPVLRNPLTPNPNYKKTSLFSLVYDITRTTGELDEFGLPITENAFIFTPEEVLIKLFALKNRLKRDFMPLNARIIDITGEGIYFEGYRQRSWNHILETGRINVGEEIEFECEPAFGFMQDLRAFNTQKYPGGMNFPIQSYINNVEPYEFNQKYPAGSVPGLLDSIRQFYQDVEQGDIEKYGDEDPFVSLDGNPVQINSGMPVILSNKSLDVIWDDLTVSWDALLSKPLTIKVSFANASPSSSSVTVGLIDQITGNEESVVVSSSPDPSGADLAAALAPIISSSSDDPFVDFNILYTPGDDFFLMRDKSRSDVLFGFIPSVGAEDFMTIERFDDGCGLTWDTLGIGQFYEIEWTVEKPGPNPFFFQLRGPICDYNEMPLFLPHPGDYKVTMVIFDLFNSTSTSIEEQCVSVAPRELEINTFARFRNREQYTWDDMVNTWEEYAGSSWDYITEGTDFGEAPIPEFLVNFREYKYQNVEFLDEETQTWIPYNGFDLPPEAPDALRRWGTKALTWDNIDVSWEDMFHTTWDQLDYHGGFLGGFEIWEPQAGDTLKVGPYDAIIIGDTSPLTSPFGLEEIAAELSASTAPGVRNFDYTVMDADTSISPFAPSPIPGGQYIQADAKFAGADGFFFIEYTAASPGTGGSDPYTFRYPTWLDRPILEVYERFLDANPGVNPDHMFLSAPESDLISGAVGTNEYWFNSENDTGSPPENGINAGQLISWAGNAAFTSSDIRGFKNDFAAPTGASIFFVTDQSQIFGKQNLRWILYKQGDDGRSQVKQIELRGQPFFIWRFEEAGDYTIELFATDANNNEYHTKRNGLIRILTREDWEDKVDGIPINSFDTFTNEVVNFS